MPQRPPSPQLPPPALGAPMAGVDESTWLDVIHKMDEVYSQLVADEVALEAKNAELEQTQQFLFSLLAAMSDVLVACNEHGAIEETNDALRELVGRSDAQLRGQPLASLLADDDSEAEGGTVQQRLRTALAAATATVVELDLRDAQGQRVPVDVNITPRRDAQGRRVGHVLVGRPMGEIKRAYHQLREAHEALKRTQQQLLHSEKMASLGRLVAGVAHELNNPISFVLGNVHALARYTGRLQRYLDAIHEGEPAAEVAALRTSLRIDHLLADLPSLMEGTLEGAQRTADIVNGLKRFSAVDREEPQRFDLNDVVERAIHWVKKGTAPVFDVRFERGAPAWVLGSPGQMLQVMMNLVQNAYDAATPRDGAGGGALAGGAVPRLDITLRRHGAMLELVFADNGPGIPEAHLLRIFEPFFTTKPVGKGTGLGLSISYGIVERHGGRLRAGHREGGGAAFTVELPAAA